MQLSTTYRRKALKPMQLSTNCHKNLKAHATVNKPLEKALRMGRKDKTYYINNECQRNKNRKQEIAGTDRESDRKDFEIHMTHDTLFLALSLPKQLGDKVVLKIKTTWRQSYMPRCDCS